MTRPAGDPLTSSGVYLFGHRGHSVDGLENSTAALAAAREYGATLCEIDLRLTRDGQFVVFHDAHLDASATGSGAVADCALAVLRAMHHRSRHDGTATGSILGFDEILASARDLGLGLIVEIKDRLPDPRYTDDLIAAVEQAKMQSKVVFSSFDHVFLRDFKADHPSITTYGIVHERHVDPVSIARAGNLDIYSVDYPQFDRAHAAALHAAGFRVAHFVPQVLTSGRLGAAGSTALDDLVQSLQSGLIDIFGCDDVAWGRALLDAHGVARAG